MELPYAVLWLSVARSRRLDDSGGAYAVNRCFGDTWLLTAGGVVLGYAYGMRTAEASCLRMGSPSQRCDVLRYSDAPQHPSTGQLACLPKTVASAAGLAVSVFRTFKNLTKC